MLLNGLSACSASGKETDLEEKTTTAGTGEKSTSENKAQISAQEDKLEVNKAKAVLKEFFSADSIHFKCLVTYKRYDAPPVDPKTFEVWTKGMKYRSDEYESGSIKFIITVVDNKAVLFSMKSKKSSEALWPPENYTDYYKWDVSLADKGIPGGDGRFYIFTIDGIDEFYKKDAAQAGYYQTKVEVGVDNEKVIYLTLYGNSSYGEKLSSVKSQQ